jgi:acyl carrier protein
MANEIERMNTGGGIEQEVVERKVREIVAKALYMEVEDVQPSSLLLEELGAESLDLLDIAFMLEREFKIEFPRTDIMERASQYFGEETLVNDGKVTDIGLELVRRGMPEIDQERLVPGMLAVNVIRMISVQTFVRIVMRLLEAKAQFPHECPNCGTMMQESDVMPELVCPKCGEITPLTSGDDILLQDLISLSKDLEFDRNFSTNHGEEKSS